MFKFLKKINPYVILLVVVVFSLPLIVATLEILTSVDRLENGLTLSQTTRFGQSLKSVFSFLLLHFLFCLSENCCSNMFLL